MLWKKAYTETIKQHLKEFSHYSWNIPLSQSNACEHCSSPQSHQQWKSMCQRKSSTRQTHSWVNTSLRRDVNRELTGEQKTQENIRIGFVIRSYRRQSRERLGQQKRLTWKRLWVATWSRTQSSFILTLRVKDKNQKEYLRLLTRMVFFRVKAQREPKYSMTSWAQPTLMRTQKVFLIKDLAPIHLCRRSKSTQAESPSFYEI